MKSPVEKREELREAEEGPLAATLLQAAATKYYSSREGTHKGGRGSFLGSPAARNSLAMDRADGRTDERENGMERRGEKGEEERATLVWCGEKMRRFREELGGDCCT